MEDSMETATVVNIVLCILSFILAAISVITVVLTLRQNSKMIEQATRPVISCYTTQINTGSPTMYLVIRNFGSSPATINQFHCEPDLVDCLMGAGQMTHDSLMKYDPKSKMPGTILAPGQSKICGLEFRKLPQAINIQMVYTSSAGKHYSETFSFDPKAGLGMMNAKSGNEQATEAKELEHISYTLQEMLQKNL